MRMKEYYEDVIDYIYRTLRSCENLEQLVIVEGWVKRIGPKLLDPLDYEVLLTTIELVGLNPGDGYDTQETAI